MRHRFTSDDENAGVWFDSDADDPLCIWHWDAVSHTLRIERCGEACTWSQPINPVVEADMRRNFPDIAWQLALGLEDGRAPGSLWQAAKALPWLGADADPRGRRSDTGEQVYRRMKERIFQERGEWYFHTREGLRGPFESERAAAADLRLYVDTMEFVEVNDIPQGINVRDVELVNVKTPDWWGHQE